MTKVNSLNKLRTDFDWWPKTEQSNQKAMPKTMNEKAQHSERLHKKKHAEKATGLKRSSVTEGRRDKNKRDKVEGTTLPSYSVVELVAPSEKNAPLAEVETPTGLKLRIFTSTQEMLDLLTSICGIGVLR
jgi:hypothetical protein